MSSSSASGSLDRADARPGELSGGEQQRIALCAAVAHSPALLVADEPTGELDEVTARTVLDLLAELAREEGAAALVVSHDPASASIADRVVHVRDGRIGEERAGGEETVVIGRGGWLRVPEESLRAAGIGERALVRVRTDVIELRPAPGVAAEAVAPAEVPRPARARSSRRAGSPAGTGTRRRSSTSTRVRPGHAHRRHRPVGLGQVDAPRAARGARHARRGRGPDRRRGPLGARPRRAGGLPPRSDRRRRADAGPLRALSARENVELALALRGVDGPEARERAMDALAVVGLADHAERAVDRLSAGERERVALARAIAGRPSVLVADEPTARLDSLTTLAVGGLLADLAREHGTTVICATHDPLLVSLAGAEIGLRRARDAAVRSA